MPRQRAPCTSNHLDASKLMQPDALTTQSVDFAAIADSSVGGGGLPRPYGRFSAARNGDGESHRIARHIIHLGTPSSYLIHDYFKLSRDCNLGASASFNLDSG